MKHYRVKLQLNHYSYIEFITKNIKEEIAKYRNLYPECKVVEYYEHIETFCPERKDFDNRLQ